MGDFYQNSCVTTFHNFKHRPIADMEQELVQCNNLHPISLIIPMPGSDLSRPALKNMVQVIKEIPYLNQVVVGLEAANTADFNQARDIFSALPQQNQIIWNEGPGMKNLQFRINEANIQLGNSNLGKNLWLCFGYALASQKADVVAMHGADILTYKREFLARLIYPVAASGFNYRFCKGYYFRADDTKINGRMVRLLITPLLRALKKLLGPLEYLEYLDGFRYALSGECAMQADVLNSIRIPNDWGLELGMLAEVYKNYTLNRICQVEIADRYDHKHHTESFDNPEKGLSKMSIDIARIIFSKLASEGCVFNEGLFRSIKATYQSIAFEILEQYHNDAVMNGYSFDRYKEERLVDLLARNVYQAGINFLSNPNMVPGLPSWKRVFSTLPDIGDEFVALVKKENEK